MTCWKKKGFLSDELELRSLTSLNWTLVGPVTTNSLLSGHLANSRRQNTKVVFAVNQNTSRLLHCSTFISVNTLHTQSFKLTSFIPLSFFLNFILALVRDSCTCLEFYNGLHLLQLPSFIHIIMSLLLFTAWFYHVNGCCVCVRLLLLDQVVIVQENWSQRTRLLKQRLLQIIKNK